MQLALVDSANRVIFGDAKTLQNNPVLEQVVFPGDSWQLAAAPLGGWTASVADVFNLVRGFGVLAEQPILRLAILLN